MDVATDWNSTVLDVGGGEDRGQDAVAGVDSSESLTEASLEARVRSTAAAGDGGSRRIACHRHGRRASAPGWAGAWDGQYARASITVSSANS